MSWFKETKWFFRAVLAIPMMARLSYRIVLWRGEPTQEVLDELPNDPLFNRDFEAIERFIYGEDY